MSGWDDLDEWVEDAAKDLTKEVKTKAGEIFMEAVTSPTTFQEYGPVFPGGGFTPVSTGNLMANTEVGINAPRSGENSAEDHSGKETYFEGMWKIRSADAWDKIYITNSTPYNTQAEFEGWSRTRPYRYWQLSYNEMKEELK